MNKGAIIFKWVVLGLLAITAVGVVTMLLWNWLVPALFNGPHITFFQALGLLLLSKLLFWGFGKHHHSGHMKPQWKQRVFEKFSDMTPEQRQAFKKKMFEKWCRWEDEPEKKRDPDSNE